jgi:hypothetical protein
MQAWRPSTQKQYTGPINKWTQYCCERSSNPFSAPAELCIEFLTDKFTKGSGYSSINTARSAIATINSNIKDNELINKFMKGVFNLRPSLPRYTCMWDLKDVLIYIEKIELQNINLKNLSKKLVLLLLLLSGQRVQTIQVLKLRNVNISQNDCIIYLDSLLKTSGPKGHKSHLHYKYYENTNLCVVSHLKKYIEMTESLRDDNIDKLLISYTKPHRAVSTDTISRWTKEMLKSSGVDINSFSAHSTRAASSSKAFQIGIPLEEILAAGSWKNAATFAKFYNKSVLETSSNFDCDLLNHTLGTTPKDK